MDFSNIPPAALGAIVAAIITGVISFVSLVISKEQKVSEFRQAWIDALREDIASQCAHAWRVYYEANGPEDPNWTIVKQSAQQNNEMSMRIRLRLNQKEVPSKKLYDAVRNLEKAAESAPDTSFEEIQAAEHAVQNAANAVLKSEWERVKKGELTYRVLRNVFLGLIIGTMTLGTATLLSPPLRDYLFS